MQNRLVTCTRARRGFSLIEIAIVLGVISTVVGGIWWAAVTISEQREANQTISDMHYAVDRAVQLMKRRNVGDTSTNTQALQLFFPPGYRAVPGTTTHVYRPGSKIAWNLNISNTSNQLRLSFVYDPSNAASPTSLSAMPAGLCMRVLLAYMDALNTIGRKGSTSSFGMVTDSGSIMLSILPEMEDRFKNPQSIGSTGVATTCNRGLRLVLVGPVYIK